MKSLFAALLLLAVSDASSFPYVIDYSGLPKTYCVERAGRCMEPAPLLPLQAGDRVSIVQSAAGENSPTIDLWVDGAPHVIDVHNSPFCVGRIGGSCTAALEQQPPVAISSNQKKMLDSVRTVLRDANSDAHSQVSFYRGLEHPLLIAMLRSPKRARTGTTAELRFAWLGGTPPFYVTVKRGSEIVAQREALSNEARFNVQLPEGRYELSVRGQSPRPDVENFDVIAARSLPHQSAADATALQTLPPQIAVVAYAAWLAKQGPEWYLAAYEALNAVPDDFPPAAQLRLYLTEGP